MAPLPLRCGRNVVLLRAHAHRCILVTRTLAKQQRLAGECLSVAYLQITSMPAPVPVSLADCQCRSDAIIKQACVGPRIIIRGDCDLQVMHAIKTALDPLGIMNPGKLGSSPASLAFA